MNPIIKKPSNEEKNQAEHWAIWEKEVSEFPWEYDAEEHCLFLEGDVIVTNESGETFHCGKGDYVVFPKGMKCTWKINKSVRKYYKIS